MQRSSRGFSLIELMIVVAIVAILAAIAYPGYQQYVRRSAIADAEMSLNGLAQALERHRAQTGSYAGAVTSNPGANETLVFRDQSPADGAAQFALAVDAANATSYSISATGVGGLIAINENLTADELGNIGGTLASEL